MKIDSLFCVTQLIRSPGYVFVLTIFFIKLYTIHKDNRTVWSGIYNVTRYTRYHFQARYQSRYFTVSLYENSKVLPGR